jgi:cation diffusion facilitator CzcD-associated flavoprotein CzcO
LTDFDLDRPTCRHNGFGAALLPLRLLSWSSTAVFGFEGKMEHTYDVIIVGAGISGINSAYRLQTELPNHTYTILEARGALGGTWDLFRYPGIRSDSDLYTFGFPWRPWVADKSIADGASIREYIKDSAAEYGIDSKVKFHHKFISGDWSTKEQSWKLTIDADGSKETYHARFIIISTGYYDYHEPMEAIIPGLDNFKGKVIHPQFWPEDYDYTGKKMVIIGSGATAVTILPVVAPKTSHVTILQRSPGYIISVPAEDTSAKVLRKLLPTWLAYKILRWKFVVIPFLFFQFCRSFPATAKKLIQKGAVRQLPKRIAYDPNFNPTYNPWEQRLCACPNGDFYKAFHRDNVDIVTSRIQNVTENSIVTESGEVLETDIIVTATGLRLQMAGGATISIDGVPIVFRDKFMWKSVMIQDVPNISFIIGHTNASWTLGADSSAIFTCRLLKYMERNQMASAMPNLLDPDSVKGAPVLNLNSTYIEKAKGYLPRVGDVGPWKRRSHWLKDDWVAHYGSLTDDMKYTKEIL